MAGRSRPLWQRLPLLLSRGDKVLSSMLRFDQPSPYVGEIVVVRHSAGARATVERRTRAYFRYGGPHGGLLHGSRRGSTGGDASAEPQPQPQPQPAQVAASGSTGAGITGGGLKRERQRKEALRRERAAIEWQER